MQNKRRPRKGEVVGGSIYPYEGKRATTWRLQYRDATGKQVKESAPTEEAARELLAERLLAVKNSRFVKREPMKFAELADRWWDTLCSSWSPATTRQYRSVKARLVETFGPMRVEDVRPTHCQTYMDRLLRGNPSAKPPVAPYSPASVSRDMSTLYAIFAFAETQELVDRNPAARIQPKKTAGFRGRALTTDERDKIDIAFTDTQDRLAFNVFVYCGIRWAELEGLRWENVDFGESILHITKSKTAAGIRQVPFDKHLSDMLWSHRITSAFKEDHDRVFCNQKTGGPYDDVTFRVALRAAFAKAGIEYPKGFRKAHDLRVTFVSLLARNAVAPQDIQELVGHQSFTTTRAYIDRFGPPPATQRAAIAVLRNPVTPELPVQDAEGERTV